MVDGPETLRLPETGVHQSRRRRAPQVQRWSKVALRDGGRFCRGRRGARDPRGEGPYPINSGFYEDAAPADFIKNTSRAAAGVRLCCEGYVEGFTWYFTRSIMVRPRWK